jgi:hypothetical protein
MLLGAYQNYPKTLVRRTEGVETVWIGTSQLRVN